MSLLNYCIRHASTVGLLYSVAVAMEKGFSDSAQSFDWWDRFRQDLLSDGKAQQKLEIILKMCIIGTSFVCGTAIICVLLLAVRKIYNFFADSKTVVWSIEVLSCFGYLLYNETLMPDELSNFCGTLWPPPITRYLVNECN